jgi:hypothetical protein
MVMPDALFLVDACAQFCKKLPVKGISGIRESGIYAGASSIAIHGGGVPVE